MLSMLIKSALLLIASLAPAAPVVHEHPVICNMRAGGQAERLAAEAWAEGHLMPGQSATLTCHGVARLTVEAGQ